LSINAADGPEPARKRNRCRYILRPVVSVERLSMRADGRVEYRFPRPDPTGRTS